MSNTGPLGFFVRHKVAANLLMLCLILGGLWSSTLITKEVFPSFTLENVNVSVSYPGATPEEIEQIADFLLQKMGLHTIVKLNPMLLGKDACRGLLHDTLGYEHLRVPDTAFEGDVYAVSNSDQR